MRYIVLLALLSGCVTSGAVQQAQANSASCWQAYQDNPSPDLYALCQQDDMQAQALASRHTRQRQAAATWQASQARQSSTSCRSTVVGQNVYTTCD